MLNWTFTRCSGVKGIRCVSRCMEEVVACPLLILRSGFWWTFYSLTSRDNTRDYLGPVSHRQRLTKFREIYRGGTSDVCDI